MHSITHFIFRYFALRSKLPWSRALVAFLLLMAAGMTQLTSHAQTTTSAVPGLISYQGKVSNADGSLVGASPNPVNRTVFFRIWSHQSNSTVVDLVYSEQQVMTISDGEFSALIGQGTAVSGNPLGFSEGSKGKPTQTFDGASVFGGATRYLGVTIDDGSAAADPEISPRQQLVSSVYAFRAKYAETLGSNGANAIVALDSGNVGVGNPNPPALLTVSGANVSTTTSTPQLVVSADDVSERLRIGVNSTGNGSSFLQSFKEGVGAQSLLLNPNGGNVGIGTTTPGFPLTFADTLGAKISLFGQSGDHFGFGIGDSRLQIYSSAASSDIAFGYGSSAAMTETMRIKGNGNVGIGTTTPGFPLSFANTRGDKISLYGQSGNIFGIGVQEGLQLYTASATTDISFGYGSSAAMTETMRIKGNGKVGIGTLVPDARLEVVSNDSVNTAFFHNTGGGGGTEPALRVKTDANSGSRNVFQVENLNSQIFVVKDNGLVGIGVSNPIKAGLHVGNAPRTQVSAGYYMSGDQFLYRDSATLPQVAIWADARIVATDFSAISDQRIKNIQGVSDGRLDLATLMGVEITDYLFKDVPANGDSPHKKVIAQQVETVFPQAVTQTTDTVPDIYTLAEIKEGWIELATDLKKGDRVKLITDNETAVHEVLEAEPDRFRTDLLPEGEKVFVFGREVKDFRIVDYDAIAMLNVSATQELKREKDADVAALVQANIALSDRVTELEASDRAWQQKLSSIERLLKTANLWHEVRDTPMAATEED